MTVTLSESARRGLEEIEAIRHGVTTAKTDITSQTLEAPPSEPVEAVEAVASEEPACRTCRSYDRGLCYKFVYATGKSGTPTSTTEGQSCADYQMARRYRAEGKVVR